MKIITLYNRMDALFLRGNNQKENILHFGDIDLFIVHIRRVTLT